MRSPARVALLFCVLTLSMAPPVLAQSWSGVYLGASGIWTEARLDAITRMGPEQGYYSAENREAINAAGVQRFRPTKALPAVQLGFNVQISRAVVGLELDYTHGSLREAARVDESLPVPPGYAFTLEQSVGVSRMFTLRPRAGVAFGPAFVFATGGLAMAQARYDVRYEDNFQFGRTNPGTSRRQMGAALGGGIEMGGRHAAFRLEYLTVTLDSLSLPGDGFTMWGTWVPPVAPGIWAPPTHDATFKLPILRAGITVRF